MTPSPETEMLSAGSGARLNKDKSGKSWSLLPRLSETSASCLEVGMGAFGPPREWSRVMQKLRVCRKWGWWRCQDDIFLVMWVCEGSSA